ncbi:hypothetical protein AB1Y20_021915 [Prymnesium parvum]|uniref:Cdc23 domain-containing protein n=1 Tax=Prymnesium parvum TaxID=97485 RepID=A0AB34JFC2_PRYPA
MAADALWACAQQSLQNHLYENAIFLAERVVAESTTEASKLLLATCYFQAGASNRAEMVLLGAKAPQNRYLLALCHMRLGKLNEAQHALLGSSSHDAAATAAVPNGAAGLYLLGMICLKSQQRERAVTYFTRCLALNPFLWSAYEALCQLGAPLPEAVKPGDSLPNCSEPPPSASTAASALPAPCATPLVGWAAASAATPVRPPQLFTPADSASVHASTVPASAGDAEMHSGRSLSTPNLLTPQVRRPS